MLATQPGRHPKVSARHFRLQCSVADALERDVVVDANIVLRSVDEDVMSEAGEPGVDCAPGTAVV